MKRSAIINLMEAGKAKHFSPNFHISCEIAHWLFRDKRLQIFQNNIKLEL
jgi:hypothetical protein